MDNLELLIQKFSVIEFKKFKKDYSRRVIWGMPLVSLSVGVPSFLLITKFDLGVWIFPFILISIFGLIGIVFFFLPLIVRILIPICIKLLNAIVSIANIFRIIVGFILASIADYVESKIEAR